MTYAKQEFYWHGFAEGSKVSRLELQRQAAKQSDKAKATLDGLIELDSKLHYIWIIFIELHNATSGAITYSEIKAYCDLSGTLTPFEIKCIMRINSEKRQSND